MAQNYCNDDIENFRDFPLDELEGWAALLEEYQHDTYKHLTPYFEQVPEILETLEALIASHYKTYKYAAVSGMSMSQL